jgi:ABC-type lipoprotein export system ATPase subunit
MINNSPLLELKNINKLVTINKKPFIILKKINYCFKNNTLYCLHGPSGAGKTTLLNIIGAIDTPSSGQLLLKTKKINYYIEKDIIAHRKNVGYVFQDDNLISELSVIENLSLPLILKGHSSKYATQQATKLLNRFSLIYLKHRNIQMLSGGEKQRLALIKAIIHQPQILLCDEPTACLDSYNRKKIIDFIINLKKKLKLLVIIASHDQNILDRAEKRIELCDGQIK